MTSKLVRFLLAMTFVVSVGAAAQTGTAGSSPAPSTALPSAPSSAAASAPVPATGTKVGTINIEQAVFGSNEGRRDSEALSKKLEPKQNELKGKSDEIDSLKKQLNTTSDKLNDDARQTLVKQIESKQKIFDRDMQDAQEEFTNQQREIMSRILQKMAPVIQKYAAENGYGVLLDTSAPWPQGPVIPLSDTMDVTKPVVDAYNAQSGVPAPAASAGGSRPAARPSAPGTKPAVAPASKPQTTAPPK
jgi:Skp family chaperone for outer membrane proteins